ncbi:MAG: glutamine-hydrolyzing GMP synthase [Pseudobdellovibrionaceae bacterium]
MKATDQTTDQKGFLVLDFGSQLTQLIARRLRELGFYSEIHPFHYPLEKIKAMKPLGIILSGGPNSVYEEEAPHRNVKELLTEAPLLGICYGMQLIAHELGGKVEKAQSKEYGFNRVTWKSVSGGENLLSQLGQSDQKVWMSHGDIVHSPPEGCAVAALSESQHIAAYLGTKILGVQFHPEVAHTQKGEEILKYFTMGMCGAKPNWKAPQIVDHLKEKILQQVGSSDHVLCGLSGGVDSSVVATLLTKTLGPDRVHCVFVNNGLLRKNEYENVLASYKAIGLNVKGVDASTAFLSALKGLTDPEAKRKAIGRVFIEVFEASLDPKWPIQWLAQGTLYPDVIESVSFKGGPSHKIKSHHNVGGLPEKMRLKLVEPVRELFKDEVRQIGLELGLPKDMIGRHPFPGPGLAIRVMGEVTEESLAILREADHIFISKLREKGLYDQIWQAFCVLLPVKTVGVQGDGRTYAQVLSLRAVTSSDGMTADWYPFTFDFLREVSNEITNKVHAINRVVYDVTSKPPGTIEWE